MNCKEIENNIWEYIEGSLEQSQVDGFVKHLDKCSHCASLEKGLRASMQVIAQSKKQEADPFFYTRLEARMQTESLKAIPQRNFSLRYALAASIAIIAMVGGSYFGSFSAEQLNSNLTKQTNVAQADDFSFDLADNSFDLIKDFE